MSTRSVVVALAVALILAGVALVVANYGGGKVPGPAGGPGAGDASIPAGNIAIAIVPAEVRSLRVEHPDGRVEIVRRTGADDGWTVTVRAETPAARDWPVDAARLRGLLHVISTARSGARPADSSLGENPTVVAITNDDGSVITLRLAGRTLAGLGHVEITTQARSGKPVRQEALVTDQIHRVFDSPGPTAWRAAAALAALSADATRLRLDAGDRAVELARVDGRWRLREPVGAPADQEAAGRVLAALMKAPIVDFLDDREGGAAADASAGLDQPSQRVLVERDRRRPGDSGAEALERLTDRWELLIGAQSSATGRTRYAQLGAGGPVVEIDVTEIARISIDPAAYAAKPSIESQPADVGMLVLEATGDSRPQWSRALRKSVGRWSEVAPDGSESALGPSGSAEAESLISLLASPAESVMLSPPEGYRPAGSLSILSLGGQPLEELDIGIDAAGAIVARNGPLWRRHPAATPPRDLEDMIVAAFGDAAVAPNSPLGAVPDVTK